MHNNRQIYDERYKGDYRQSLSGFEVARWDALQHFIPNVARLINPTSILDYGSGTGLYVPLWMNLFPDTEISCCDISSVALEKLTEKFPALSERCKMVVDYRADFDDSMFDAIISVEVMEHIDDLQAYLRDIHRLLKPGGSFIWTTPCANRFSIEHVFYSLTGGIERTPDGYRRWKMEAPVHVRRLKTGELKRILISSGFENVDFRFRSHLFSFICTFYWPRRLRKLGESLMKLDYRLFRWLPNGASMLGVARKKV